MKRMTVTTRGHTVTVEIPNAAGELTPALARRAARIAFGHTDGVTVSDGRKAYRLRGRRARLLKPRYD